MVNELEEVGQQYQEATTKDNNLKLLFQKKKQELEVMEKNFLSKATVLQVAPNNKNYLIVCVGQDLHLSAIKASSCLQQPVVGDVVSVQGFEDGSVYILAVLESNVMATEQTILELPNNTLIKAKELRVETQSYSLSSEQHQLNTVTFNLVASNVKQVSENFEVVANLALSSFVNSHRYVSDTDRVTALNINYSSEAVSKFSGKVTMLNGHELLKSDGKLMIVG
jgi:hypothetical protein